MLPEEIGERHRVVAEGFAQLTRGVGEGGWDAPAPVEGWAARDVVRHLVTWLPGFLAGGSDVVLLAGPSVDDDPAEAWRVHAEQVQTVLDDPALSGLTYSNPHTGEHPLGVAIDRFYTTDVFLHSWDLAAATAQDARLDPDFAAQVLEGMQPIDAMLRASGQYGPKVAWPADAPVVERLAAFIGRDPGFAGRAR
ncbi:MAG: TIGR03086 family metal-binding protein [Herbiconiux sp.]|nr:TIGR03086 family metal-binding protein [Herbiconiux sp.]